MKLSRVLFFNRSLPPLCVFPLVVPSAPGNVAKRLSKVRFSWMRMTTCVKYLPSFAGGGGGKYDDPAEELDPPHPFSSPESIPAKRRAAGGTTRGERF
jgi:hypothetical protein